jgi:hypothetical protein
LAIGNQDSVCESVRGSSACRVQLWPRERSSTSATEQLELYEIGRVLSHIKPGNGGTPKADDFSDPNLELSVLATNERSSFATERGRIDRPAEVARQPSIRRRAHGVVQEAERRPLRLRFRRFGSMRSFKRLDLRSRHSPPRHDSEPTERVAITSEGVRPRASSPGTAPRRPSVADDERRTVVRELETIESRAGAVKVLARHLVRGAHRSRSARLALLARSRGERRAEQKPFLVGKRERE